MKVSLSRQSLVNYAWAGVVLLVIAAVTYSSVEVVTRNYALELRIAELTQSVDIKSKEVENARLRNRFYATDTFKEIEARRLFNRAQPGESLILVPLDVARAYVPESVLTPTSEVPGGEDAQQPLGYPWGRLQAWWNFIRGRGVSQ